MASILTNNKFQWQLILPLAAINGLLLIAEFASAQFFTQSTIVHLCSALLLLTVIAYLAYKKIVFAAFWMILWLLFCSSYLHEQKLQSRQQKKQHHHRSPKKIQSHESDSISFPASLA